MGLFLRPKPPVESRSWPLSSLEGIVTMLASAGGRSVSIEESLRASAVWACLRVLAGSASMLPVDVVRYQGRSRLPVDPQPSMVAEPSALVERDVWVHQIVWSMFTDGNAFGLITGVGADARPTFIETVHPTQVTERKVVDGMPQAKVDGTVHKLYPYGDLWHVPGPMVPAGSPWGLSPVQHGATGIRAALAAELFGADFFADGAHPSSIVYSDEKLTPDQAAGIKASIVKLYRGNREPAVLGSGLKWEKVTVDPDDSQFIELLRFEVENQCRFFGVPPSMVYGAVSGQSVTYANVSQADLHYLKHSLEVPVGRLERAWSRLIPRPQMVRLNRDALLRSDALTRWQVYKTRLDAKTITVNQVRALEDEPPFTDPAYDEPGIPGGPTPEVPIP